MDTDFAIVGGGIVGASVAYHLSKRTDGRITVFEREASLAAETTAKSNAMFRMTGGDVEREMKRYGLALYNELLADPKVDHDVDPLYERTDRLEVATSRATASALRERAEAGTGRHLEPDEIADRVLFPELQVGEIEGALLFPDAIRFEPRALTFEFVERARANGARFETATAVRDVRVNDGRVTGLETDAGAVDVDVVVSAAGPSNAAVASMAGIEIPLRHTLGPILDVQPRRLRHVLPNLKHADTGVYYTGRADGTVMIGRAGGAYENAVSRDLRSLDETRVPADIRDEMAETSARLLPALAIDAVEIRDEWVGLVSKTPDGNPIVGRTAVDGFAIAAFNSEAIQLAPAAGRIIAEQLLDDRPPSEYPHLSPARFEAPSDTPGRGDTSK